jgi:hypothetical protein
LDRFTDLGMVFQQQWVKAMLFEQLTEITADRAGPDNNDLNWFFYHDKIIIVYLLHQVKNGKIRVVNKTLAIIFLLLLTAAAWAEPPTAVASSENLVVTATVTAETVIVHYSSDRGLNWHQPVPITITGETVSQPRLAFDNLMAPQLIFLSFNKYLNRHRLYYTSLSSLEPRVIFESQDDIVNINVTQTLEVLRLDWQTDYLGRQTAYVSVSLDQGKHFGSAHPLSGFFPPLAAPVLTAPRNGTLSNLSSPEVKYRPNAEGPLITKVELSWDKTFPLDKSWSFEYLDLPGTIETDAHLPLSLPDGEYFVRLSAHDGLRNSPTNGPVSFRIDTKAPVITLSSPSAEVSDDNYVSFAGTVGESVKLTLNGRSVSVEAGGGFSCSASLLSGKNTFEVLATDEAGNTTRLTRTISYYATIPHLKITRPRADDWFKPGSTIYFSAEVNVSLDNIEDESDGTITVNKQELADKPVYDQSTKTLSGFISLPAKLSDGRLTATVRLNDRSGGTGQKEFSLNIDNTPPSRTAATDEAVYTGSACIIPLPLNDAGSGLDLQGTVVKMNGISLEATLTIEAGPAARTKLPLADGSYEVTVLPRDNVGNTGEAIRYILIVDTLPPLISLDPNNATVAKAPRLLVSGEASDRYLSGINFYNGQTLVGSLNAPANNFAYDLPLLNGNNNIRVEAVDRAGNKTSCSYLVKAEVASAGLISKFAPAPCPFSPRTDRTMNFIFSFSATPDLLKVYIFDLAGTLLWKKELSNFSGNTLAWNGMDMFGRYVGNGVYPYLASATLGGQTEIKKGKLIVLQ